MGTLAIFTLALVFGLTCKATRLHNRQMAQEFDHIEPSANLTWTPCFDSFACSRLEVPLDYENTCLGTTSIAFIKLSGKNASANSPTIVLMPGGPGGSGIDVLKGFQPVIGQMLGEQYNYVSFDPRGVGNSGPKLDCFAGNKEAETAFSQLHRTGVTDNSTLEEQWYSGSIYGDWCNDAVERDSPHGYYITTPAVARDLLTFIEANAVLAGQPPSDAKLWAYGGSYGTVTGTTFASMFPDRVGRMVLDGLVDANHYYENDWRDNVGQMDEAMGAFSRLCHAAGPDGCAFWGPSPANITTRLDDIYERFQRQPVPISGLPERDVPAMATFSDLQALVIDSLYLPTARFPVMAEILSQIESGNASALVGRFSDLMAYSNVRISILCTDSYRRNKLATIDDFRDFAEYTASASKYAGSVWTILQDNMLCRGIRPDLPDSMVMEDPVGGPDKKTSFPILFTSNTIDPISPLNSAYVMSSRFPGSAVLLQNAIGHTVIEQGASPCYLAHVQDYFQGVIPPANVTCEPYHLPFIGDRLS